MSLPPHAQEIIDTILALSSAEDRLTYLMEREVRAGYLPESERTPEYQIKECVSGLWIKGEKKEGAYAFRAWSNSEVVRAVVCAITDLMYLSQKDTFSDVSQLVQERLSLTSLLTSLRKRAVQVTLERMAHYLHDHE